MRVGIIGLGDVSGIHINAIKSNENLELVSVCDIDDTKRNTVENVNFYNDYIEMIKNENLDCVHVCLPHYLHYDVTEKIASLGVNILLEKPLCINLDEVEKFEKLYENTNVDICVCLQNRYNETFEKLNEILKNYNQEDILGIKGIVTWSRQRSYYEDKPWRGSMKLAGGGVMMNQSIHTLDLMQLLGNKIKSIKGNICNLTNYDIEVEDTSNAVINFEKGYKGMFFSTIAYSQNSNVEFEVSLKDVRYLIKDNVLYEIKDEKRTKIIEDDKLDGSKHYYGASHKKLINHFYDCIGKNSKEYVTIKDAINSVKMIDSIVKSSNENKELNWEE